MAGCFDKESTAWTESALDVITDANMPKSGLFFDSGRRKNIKRYRGVATQTRPPAFAILKRKKIKKNIVVSPPILPIIHTRQK